MGNAAQCMEEDQCKFKEICNKNNKKWCNDFKLLEQGEVICTIFEVFNRKNK